MMAYVALLSSLVRRIPFAMESTDYHYRTARKREEAISRGYRLSAEFVGLDSLNVFGLQALGAFGDAELHRLALLEALESARLDGREMHENVFARLPADKAVALGVIEPLYCSLFHVFCTLVSFLIVTLEGFGRTCAGDWLLRRELLKTDSV